MNKVSFIASVVTLSSILLSSCMGGGVTPSINKKVITAPTKPPVKKYSFAPEMTKIPQGSFSIGCTSKKNCKDSEFPIRTVKIASFFMSKTEVTFAQWDACVKAGGCSHRPSDNGWGRGKRPVINVSWYQTQEYLKWLSKATKTSYRLPTEAEWEYAARAGSRTQYSFGNDPAGLCDYDNHADQSTDYFYRNKKCSDGVGKKTAKVGSYKPNKWGLYDMHGNVREWTCSSLKKRRLDSSVNKCADSSSDLNFYVLRGGSWRNHPNQLRSANRHFHGFGNISRNEYGFRVARD